MVKIMPCRGCKKHLFQDERYGFLMRVFNSMKKGSDKWRCTVCSAIIYIATPKKEDKKKVEENG